MARRIVLGTVLFVGALSIALTRTPPPQAGVAAIEKVKDNLYMITGGGGNTAAQKDIIWRSRSGDAIALLSSLILHPATGEKERLRYFRAFDFHRKPEEQPAKANILLMLATSDKPDVSALALKHLAGVQGADPGRVRAVAASGKAPGLRSSPSIARASE